MVDGIIKNGTHIVIPKSLQAEYLKCLHAGHFGTSKCHARAKSTVYWPGIDRDITNLIGSCDVCREVQHTPRTFDEHTTEACYPGHIYGTDIGNIQGKPPITVVAYFSFFIHERPLPDMMLDTVILALKTIFSEAGAPTILISYNGRQYCSEEFKEFSLKWSFIDKTSSLYYPKGNAHAERAIGIIKEVYTQCEDDFLLELLVHRATPLLSYNKSPAELFLGHKIATNIPCIPFGMAALVHCTKSPVCVRQFNLNDGDIFNICIDPNVNSWQKGIVIRSHWSSRFVCN